MFAQLITSGAGLFDSPAAPCISGGSPHPGGACFESGAEPVRGNCINNGYVPAEDGGCFFGWSPH